MDILELHPPTGSEVQERKDAALKALAMLDVLQEQKRQRVIISPLDYPIKLHTNLLVWDEQKDC